MTRALGNFSMKLIIFIIVAVLLFQYLFLYKIFKTISLVLYEAISIIIQSWSVSLLFNFLSKIQDFKSDHPTVPLSFRIEFCVHNTSRRELKFWYLYCHFLFALYIVRYLSRFTIKKSFAFSYLQQKICYHMIYRESLSSLNNCVTCTCNCVSIKVGGCCPICTKHFHARVSCVHIPISLHY